MNTFSLKQLFQNLSQLKEITPYQKAVLTSLVSFFGKKGCFPSHTTLAIDAGVSPRTVAKVLKEARLRGWLDWTNERIGRRQSSNRYRFTIDNKYISKIRDAVKAIKEKSAVFQYVHRLHATQRSPYYYINEERKKMWKKIIEPKNGLSPFQRLFKENPELALKQFMAS
ncbi:hypothetical protein CIN_22080 [Commensalibacter intestini A911]|uniref:Helix-turn-helix domain-containing protein n=1 Tax=Commensalibacter intestini A911 TaxID=1088868 RepID=G6F3L2_9PROT|nr:helix-turn-helix domain-containing protein [Commensalibacter intestini]EHD12868.1 hypothetical protein CIN_22080 [Commensalibacter intestini A911]